MSAYPAQPAAQSYTAQQQTSAYSVQQAPATYPVQQTMQYATTTTTTTRQIQPGNELQGKVGVIILTLILSMFFFLIGFVSTAWSVVDLPYPRTSIQYGMWEYCSCQSYGDLPDWFMFSQAMIALSLISLIVALVMVMVYSCVYSVSKKTALLVLAIFCFLAASMMFVGFTVFAAKMKEAVSWSFVMIVFSFLFCGVSAILSVMQFRYLSTTT